MATSLTQSAYVFLLARGAEMFRTLLYQLYTGEPRRVLLAMKTLKGVEADTEVKRVLQWLTEKYEGLVEEGVVKAKDVPSKIARYLLIDKSFNMSNDDYVLRSGVLPREFPLIFKKSE